MLLMFFFEETSRIISPAASGAEALVSAAVQWLVLMSEVIAAVLIGLGIVLTLVSLIKVLGRPKYEGYEKTRLTLARLWRWRSSFNWRRTSWQRPSHRAGPKSGSWAPSRLFARR